jgi:hypothetical protein
LQENNNKYLDGWRTSKNNYSSLSLKIVPVDVITTVADTGCHEKVHVTRVYTLPPPTASCLLMEKEVTYIETDRRTAVVVLTSADL